MKSKRKPAKCAIPGCQGEAKYECEDCDRVVCARHARKVTKARGVVRYKCAECAPGNSSE